MFVTKFGRSFVDTRRYLKILYSFGCLGLFILVRAEVGRLKIVFVRSSGNIFMLRVYLLVSLRS